MVCNKNIQVFGIGKTGLICLSAKQLFSLRNTQHFDLQGCRRGVKWRTVRDGF